MAPAELSCMMEEEEGERKGKGGKEGLSSRPSKTTTSHPAIQPSSHPIQETGDD